MKKLIKLFSWMILILLGSAVAAAEITAPEKPKQLFPAPEWIKFQTVSFLEKEPADQIEDGIFLMLYDHQIQSNADSHTHYYKHFVEKIVSTKGLETASTIKVDFDPQYQQVEFYSVNIIRDGKITNVFPQLKISVLNREQELVNSIYNGLYSYHLIIPDLRVGDLIDYSYGLRGDNTIYAGHFSGVEYLDWSVPVAHQHFLIDWLPKNKTLNFQRDNTEIDPEISEVDGHKVYEITRGLQPLKKYNSQAPAWHNVYQRIYYSDINSWGDVVRWGLPLYSLAIQLTPDIKTIAQNIQQNSKTDEEKIANALHYVQSQIRYLGIEMGENSHKPSIASDTLNRRYGDCKDKVVLLVTLLHALGIESFPALANTEEQLQLEHRLPSLKAFDHVIVNINLAGQNYWLDPTRSFQRGSLKELSQSDFGFALVIKPNENQLQRMNGATQFLLAIEEHWDLSQGIDKPVTYRIDSYYSGGEAEYARSNHADSNLEATKDKYLNFYKNYYSKISASKDVEYQDFENSDDVHIAEYYTLDEFWKEKPKGKYTADFYASAISSEISKPDQKVRTQPFRLNRKNMTEKLIIQLDAADWDLPSEEKQITNAFFNFSYKSNFDKSSSKFTLSYEYKTLAKFVPADEIENYLDAREKAIALTEYSVYQIVHPKVAQKNTYAYSDADVWISLCVMIYLILIITALLSWFFDADRKLHDESSAFYTVSLSKFLLLGFLTCGFYLIVWNYNNWKQIKRQEMNSVIPLLRGIFYALFIYPLVKRVAFYGGWSNRIQETSILIGFSITILALNLLVFWFNHDFSLLVLEIVLFGFLVNRINKICAANQDAYIRHSRFKLRHFALMIMGTPLLVYLLGQELGMIPSEDVIKGSQLTQGDLKFLQRSQIVSAKEKITYFYSSEIFSKAQSGCGFTPKHVFTYWHDENSQLQFESIKYSDIKSIDAQEADGFFQDKTIVITRQDDSEVTLYIPSGRLSEKFIKKLNENWQAAETE